MSDKTDSMASEERREKRNAKQRAYRASKNADQRRREVKTSKAWRAKNAERLNEKRRLDYLHNKDKYRDKHLRLTYSVTLEQYNVMLASQDGGCAICKTPPDGKNMLHVDHDHATGKVRGLLCQHCNHALGNMKDNPDLLRKAANYIEVNNG